MGQDRKFCRVIVGAILPILDRQLGVAIIMGENYSALGPASWLAFEAVTGEWQMVENRLIQWRRDMRFTHIVVDSDPSRDVIWRMKPLQYGMSEVPYTSYVAPDYSEGEIGRSYMDTLIAETRFILPDTVRKAMEYERDTGKAAQMALCYCRQYPQIYQPMKKPVYQGGDILGVEGL